ncbi:hypothetical protein ABVK25_002383 [Lepraria finkii]|uniref:Imidazoleglycerol-phosphate dehydratase protein n=1 Tax=Lepraria finkii TaxID=1340010 RepID=A0ABR4BI55_9LECA
MPRYGQRTTEESSAAGSEALRGAVVGGAKWGLLCGGLGIAGYFLSPIYRSLTVQFKVYIQMSGMTLGAWLEADRRLRAYEFAARRERKRVNDEAVWRRWEGMVEEEERKEVGRKQEKG